MMIARQVFTQKKAHPSPSPSQCSGQHEHQDPTQDVIVKMPQTHLLGLSRKERGRQLCTPQLKGQPDIALFHVKRAETNPQQPLSEPERKATSRGQVSPGLCDTPGKQEAKELHPQVLLVPGRTERREGSHSLALIQAWGFSPLCPHTQVLMPQLGVMSALCAAPAPHLPGLRSFHRG